MKTTIPKCDKCRCCDINIEIMENETPIPKNMGNIDIRNKNDDVVCSMDFGKSNNRFFANITQTRSFYENEKLPKTTGICFDKVYEHHTSLEKTIKSLIPILNSAVDLKIVKSYVIIENMIKFEVDILPKYYVQSYNPDILNKQVRLLDIKPPMKSERITKIDVKIDQYGNVCNMKINANHANADKNDEYCLGNERFKKLDIQTLRNLMDSLNVYNFDSSHKNIKDFIHT